MSFGPNCPICNEFACECAGGATKGDILLAAVVALVILSGLVIMFAIRSAP